MNQNCVEGIRAALETFDGCELDVRLTKDGVAVLHHNSKKDSKRILTTRKKDLKEVDAFADLLSDKKIRDQINKNCKTLWVEAKEDSYSKKRNDIKYCKKLAKTIEKEINNSGLDKENIYIISFCPLILDQFKDLKTVWIVPYLNATTDSFFPHYNLLTVIMMLKSLKHFIKTAKERGYSGLFFTKLYLKGFFSITQPSIENLIKLAGPNFVLGTEAQSREEEKLFSKLIVVTDHRGKKRNNGRLICHRGKED